MTGLSVGPISVLKFFSEESSLQWSWCIFWWLRGASNDNQAVPTVCIPTNCQKCNFHTVISHKVFVSIQKCIAPNPQLYLSNDSSKDPPTVCIRTNWQPSSKSATEVSTQWYRTKSVTKPQWYRTKWETKPVISQFFCRKVFQLDKSCSQKVQKSQKSLHILAGNVTSNEWIDTGPPDFLALWVICPLSATTEMFFLTLK